MHATPYPLFSVFAFLGFLVGLIPLPWHMQAWNAGTCIYMIWASFACLIQFVDSIIWNGTAEDLAPVWCDISTKFLIGAGVGIPAASLCINRRLYKITSIRTVSITREEKRRDMIWDLSIAIGIPVLVMILHYIVQGHRFNILEDVGCLPEIFNTPPAYPLVFMWPVLLGCISFVYASLTLRSFWIRRAQFNQLLATNKAMTTSRYFRLMLLSCAEMACTIPLGAYSIYINTAGVQLAPWVSWSNAHYDFSRVVEVPAVVWTSERSYLISVEMGRWIYPFSAFLFFSLFGFAKEAQRNYRLAFNWIVKLFGRKPSKAEAPVISFIRFRNPLKASRALSEDTLPQYSPPTRMKRVDSLSSFLAGGPGGADLEKDVPLGKPPMTQSETSTVTSIERDTGHPIIISDAYPASRPPSPHIISYPEPAAIPSFHRPFSPPTIYPVSPTHAAASDSSIQVNIQTEAVQSV